MRPPLQLIAALVFAALSADGLAQGEAPVASSSVTIVRVFTGWRDGASFKRIAEYFDGKEHSGREVILRSHPEQRTGYYFLVRLKHAGAPLKAAAHLQLIAQGWPAPRTTVFPLEVPAGSTAFQLGLTGPEWQDKESHPIAWHLQVIDDGGRVLAAEKSYLWEKPAGK